MEVKEKTLMDLLKEDRYLLLPSRANCKSNNNLDRMIKGEISIFDCMSSSSIDESYDIYSDKEEKFKMKKVFISVAVRGLNKEETVIKHEEYRNKIIKIIGDYEDISIDNPDCEPFTGITSEKPAAYWLGQGIQKELAKADLAVFCGDISNTKGCKVEKLICELYGIPHLIIQ